MRGKDELKCMWSIFTSWLCILSTGAKTVWEVIVTNPPFRELGLNLSSKIYHRGWRADKEAPSEIIILYSPIEGFPKSSTGGMNFRWNILLSYNLSQNLHHIIMSPHHWTISWKCFVMKERYMKRFSKLCNLIGIFPQGGVLRFELDRGVPLEPQNPYPSLRVILAEKGTHF